MSPRLALAAALSVGTPFGEVEVQDRVALEERSVEAVGDGAAPGMTTASGTIGPSPGFGAARAVSVTRTATPQIDVPQVVTIAPREAITDLAAPRVDQVSN